MECGGSVTPGHVRESPLAILLSLPCKASTIISTLPLRIADSASFRIRRHMCFLILSSENSGLGKARSSLRRARISSIVRAAVRCIMSLLTPSLKLATNVSIAPAKSSSWESIASGLTPLGWKIDPLDPSLNMVFQFWYMLPIRAFKNLAAS